MHYDLLIVGNGFDLACDYKTSYYDFLEYCRAKGITNPLISFFLSAYRNDIVANNEWNGFENLLCQYLQFIDYLFNNDDNIDKRFTEQFDDSWGNLFYRYYEIKILDISKAPLNIFLTLMLANPLERMLNIYSDSEFKYHFSRIDDYKDIKEVYFRVFVNAPLTKLNHRSVLNYLLKELELRLQKLEDELKKYISLSTNDGASVPTFLFDLKVDKVMSFNYSRTAQCLYELEDDNIAYVHGSIDSNIVVGVEQSMIDGQTFKEESDYMMFFKRFRRIYKDCNKNYNSKIINQLNSDSIIGIYGHSLNLADSSLLRPIFSKEYKRYDIYCHKNVNDYKIKLVNLITLDLYDKLEKDGKIKLIKVD